MKITYQGRDKDGVRIKPNGAEITVKIGGTVDVPDAIAPDYLANGFVEFTETAPAKAPKGK